MEYLTGIIILAMFGVVAPNPTTRTESFDDTITQMRSNCENGVDSMDCLKLKVVNFFDTAFKTDNYKISDDIEVRSNGYVDQASTLRSNPDFLSRLQRYIQSHDVAFKLPFSGPEVIVSPRNMINNELNLNLKFGTDVTEPRGKSKLKKIAIPIMVFVLLKAMTLIPLALGVLGLKAFNALQLGFLSFVVSVGLALFQLCKKLASDHHHPHIAAHGPWDSRTFSAGTEPDYQAQNLAYSAYTA